MLVLHCTEECRATIASVCAQEGGGGGGEEGKALISEQVSVSG